MSALLTLLGDFAEALFSTTSGSEGLVVQLFNWVTSTNVLPFFGLGIVVSLVSFAFLVINRTVWGR